MYFYYQYNNTENSDNSLYIQILMITIVSVNTSILFIEVFCVIHIIYPVLTNLAAMGAYPQPVIIPMRTSLLWEISRHQDHDRSHLLLDNDFNHSNFIFQRCIQNVNNTNIYICVSLTQKFIQRLLWPKKFMVLHYYHYDDYCRFRWIERGGQFLPDFTSYSSMKMGARTWGGRRQGECFFQKVITKLWPILVRIMTALFEWRIAAVMQMRNNQKRKIRKKILNSQTRSVAIEKLSRQFWQRINFGSNDLLLSRRCCHNLQYKLGQCNFMERAYIDGKYTRVLFSFYLVII